MNISQQDSWILYCFFVNKYTEKKEENKYVCICQNIGAYKKIHYIYILSLNK